MRLAAQRTGGFYPAHEQAVAHAAGFLRPPQDKPFSILDPCAGEGKAIHQLADLLGCPSSMTYAIELDDSRALTLKATVPDAHVLAPASFFGCRSSMSSFSFIWLNPPFDDGYGGHRVEDEFLHQATDWLKPGGVIAFVCPEDVVDEYSDARQHLQTYYQNCKIVPFPEDVRAFKEVIVFGQKRARPVADQWASNLWESAQAPAEFVYQIPPGTGPRVFLKVEPTEAELEEMLAHSPLRSRLQAPPEEPLPSPPLSLGIGHVALLLASGHLNGTVEPEGKPPHVVRGSSRKTEYVSEVTETEENEDGSTTTKTIISERIELVVRTVDISGRLQTFLESGAE